MFEDFEPAQPDAILGLVEAFKNDANPAKINLSVGVFKDAEGNTPILPSVKAAEQQILRDEVSKAYLPMTGLPEFGSCVQQLLFGSGHDLVEGGRAVTAQTPGGTGALRVAGDFVRTMAPGAKIWLSDPTWPNHPGIFQAAGLAVETYPYFDAATNSLAADSMLTALGRIPAGDVVVLHGCCHNPTGVDPSVEQWQQIAEVVRQRRLLPLIDFAYQGFAEGLESDAGGVRVVVEAVPEALLCSSFSKNFGLYNERVGALTLIGRDRSQTDLALGHLKLRIRTNYSNPPVHGATIVTTILQDPAQRTVWEDEVRQMRSRINGMRELFVKTLRDKGVSRDFSFISRQRGMFSFSGLTPDQVESLRKEYAIYIVSSGRVNVAGMTEANMDPLCEAIAAVVGAG
ncbi:MAG: amino acid aminotransferase [Pirellulales bacterium]|nr:amino acid aminotransferase [Pirellulales bacterium]